MVVLVRRTVARNPERLQQEMEEVFRALLPARPRFPSQTRGAWRPPLEVYETERELVIIAEIAGVSESDLTIIADSEMVTIRGYRTDPQSGTQRRYREIGIPYGEFAADIFLPFPVDLDAVHAEYNNGLLRIELPRVRARTIVPKRTHAPAVADGQE
ncbi:MAG: Hsp20/alpha crystallin family protein [Thermomicrobiales bacterium]|nr:Hsp20/alpha crystallin family protein [Thermomicrobiales bacterium]